MYNWYSIDVEVQLNDGTCRFIKIRALGTSETEAWKDFVHGSLEQGCIVTKSDYVNMSSISYMKKKSEF